MRDLVLGLGVVAVVEGLVLVLIPMRLEDVIKAIARLGKDQRRIAGLLIMTLGAALVWVAKNWG
ncbi:MAG: DUF2065 family protein [Rhodobacteraceae bacterium]|nr:DUF2065 family protein [Paracoccaceae bacterium]MCY4142011.1 DUF2065 family protein [Paracoccaceae bacterium]